MKKIILALSLCFASAIFFSQESQDETLYRETAEKVNDLVHTKLAVSFNFETSQMYGEEWVTLTPHFYPTQNVVLDAKAMDIHEVKLGNKKAKYTYENDFLTIDLAKTYKKGENIELYIKYTANPEKVKQEGSAAISDAKGLYFIDPKDTDPDKPTQIWTQGETESASCWFPTIDKPNQKTTQEISITVPENYLTLSNGEMVSSKKAGKGNRTDEWKFDKKHAPYLFFMGIGEFAVVKDKWRNVEVDYYVEPEYEDVAKDIFGLTPEMIEFFSNKMDYDFPWNKYSQMVGRDYVSGAMENTTAVIFGEFVQKKKGDLVDENIAESIVAHELFHHWFGDLVTTESWSNLTVNESFANYSEYLWFEHKYGKERAEAHRFEEISGYNTPKNFEKNLVRFHYKSREDMFDGVSYNKGGLILHMLRNYLGDDAFFAGLNKYLKDNEYQAAEAHQLRLALEEVSGKDLNVFFNQWYFGSGHPQLKVANSFSAGKVKVTIDQTQENKFEFPLAIDVYVDNKPTRHTVWVKAQDQNTFSFDAAKQPNLVNVNADYVLLCDIDETKTAEEYIFQYKNGKEYGDRLLAIDYFGTAQNNNKEALNTLISAFNDSNFELQQLALHNFDAQNPENLKLAIPTLEKLANSANTHNKVKALAIELLAQTEDSKYNSLFKNNSAVVSNSIKAAAISGLMKTDKTAALEAVDKLDADAITPDLGLEIIDQLIEKNDVSKMKIFGEYAAIHELIAFQNPDMGAKAKKAFDWIMKSDNASGNNAVQKTFSNYIGHFKEANPQVATMLKGTVQKAINIKKEAALKDTKNENLKNQILALEELLK